MHPRSDERHGTAGSERVNQVDAPATRKLATARAPLRQGLGWPRCSIGGPFHRPRRKKRHAKCINALAFVIEAFALMRRRRRRRLRSPCQTGLGKCDWMLSSTARKRALSIVAALGLRAAWRAEELACCAARRSTARCGTPPDAKVRVAEVDGPSDNKTSRLRGF